MAKTKAKQHYPPAYYKYRKEHPTVSIVLSKETKTALDKARGEMSYARYLTSLINPDGVFSQFQKQKAQLVSEKVSFENEKKKQMAQLASERRTLEIEKTNLEKEELTLFETERFYVPCSKCGKPMQFDNTQPIWNREIKPMLLNTFKLYFHIVCDQ